MFSLGFSDQSILLVTNGTSVLITLFTVLLEIVFKLRQGSGLIGTAAFFLYLGAGEDDLNPTPWGLYSFAVSICLYAGSLLVYQAVKYKKNR